MLPDACILADFALFRLARLVDGLVVYPERMQRNLDATQGLYGSQRVLLALTEAGLARQRAYELVQAHAMRAWREGRPLEELLLQDPEVTGRLGEERLLALFDLGPSRPGRCDLRPGVRERGTGLMRFPSLQRRYCSWPRGRRGPGCCWKRISPARRYGWRSAGGQTGCWRRWPGATTASTLRPLPLSRRAGK